MNYKKEIKSIAKEKDAIILAHNYQNDEIQEIADFTGDSLELSHIGAKSKAKLIIFCGVHFMAESAAILSPEKKIILPDKSAGCPMADMIMPDDVEQLRALHPDASVVTYINTTAAVKAKSDICCTSSNALKVVQRVNAGKIIFVPDKNLGSYVNRFTDKEIILWNGFCPAHNEFSKKDLHELIYQHSDAVIIVHPECSPEIIDLADEVVSTGGMVKFVQKTKHKKIIVGTEKGMLFKLKTVAPDKEYILASDSFICQDMKKITIEKLYISLIEEKPLITVNNEIALKAKHSLDKMLSIA